MKIQNKHSIIIISILTLILFVEAFFLIVLPKIVNISAKKHVIERIFAKKTNGTLAIKGLKLKTHADFSASLYTEKIIIKNKQNQELINATKLKVRLPLLPLIFKNVNIKYVSALELKANVERDKKGVFNLENLIIKNNKKVFKVKIRNAKYNISKYEINFEDKMFDRKFELNGNYFKVDNFTMKKLIDIETDGEIHAPGVNTVYQLKVYSKLPVIKNMSDKNFLVSGYIKNLEPKYFEPYIKKYCDKDIKKISGNTSFNFYTKKLKRNKKEIIFEGVVNELAVKKDKTEDSIYAKGKNFLYVSLDLDKNKIYIKRFSLRGVNYSLKAEGQINRYKDKKPELDLKIELPKSRTENIAAILPSNLIPNRYEIKKVKKYGLFGDIEGNVSVKGRIPQPNIIGNVTGSNVHILKGFEGTHIGQVGLNFDKRILHVNVDINLLKTNENVKVKGLTHIFRDGTNHFEITSSKTVELALAQKLLLPIQDVFLFQLGPVPEMKLTAGKGQVNLDIRGTRESGVVKGFVNFTNTTASYNGVNAIINNGDGEVTFHGKKVDFKTKKAFLKKSPVSIFGTAVMEGDLDLNIQSPNINCTTILEVLHTSSLLKEISDKLTVIKDAKGPTSFKINIKAKIPPMGAARVNVKELLDDLNVLGSIDFKNASCVLDGFSTPITQVMGKVTFTQKQVDLTKITGKIGNSIINLNGKVINDLTQNIPDIDILVESNRIALKDSISFLINSDYAPKFNHKNLPLGSISGDHTLKFIYRAKTKDIDLNAISVESTFLPNKQNKPISVVSGKLKLDKGSINIENLNTRFYNSPTTISGNIKGIFDKSPKYKLTVNSSDFDIKILDSVQKYKNFPKKLKFILAQYTEYRGKTNFNLTLDNEHLKGRVDLNDVSFLHKESGVPIKIYSTIVKLDSNRVIIKPITATVGTSPLFAEVIISDLLTEPSIDGYFTTKITNDFVDTYVNSKMTYPIKVKGDIALSADLSGTIDNLGITPVLKFNEGSDLSYLSANLGDENTLRELQGNIFVSPTAVSIKRLDYIKYQTSQNNRTYPMNFATIKGSLLKHKNTYVLDSLYVKTYNNLPARLLNFAFKKSILKQGTFNCSLFYKANSKTNIPKVFGNIDLKNLDIPLYDTLIKDVSIHSNRETINADIKGSIFQSDFSIKADVSNTLSPPVTIKNILITSEKFNFDKLIETMNKMSMEAYQKNTAKASPQPQINVSNLIINKGHLTAGDVTFKSLPAHNLNADFKLENSLLSLSNLHFDVASGTLTGDGEYNFKTTNLETELVSKGVDANLLADALFDMKNQIYGDMNGQLYLRTRGSSQEEKLKNLDGQVYFKISNGRMPKLGSLEYLLRAGNIIKSGITGLTINSIIDLVNPIKTGHFSSINGSFFISNGVAKNVEIYSKGENLSIYVKGTYDLVNSNADMKVLGRLSKKIPTILGPIGNTSLNSFFNIIPGITLSESDKSKFMRDISKIPGLDFTNDDYRIFQAKIDGNINGNNYVSSFKWVE